MPTKDPILAAILSFLLPGLGQFYCRQWGRGVAFLLGVALFAVLLPPFGFLLSLGVWVWAIADAYRQAPDSEGQGLQRARVLELKRRALPRIDLRPVLAHIAVPAAAVAAIVLVAGIWAFYSGFWRFTGHGEDLRKLIERIERYKADMGTYPDSLASLIDPTSPIEKRLVTDRWGNLYIYRPTENGFEIKSAGPDGRPGTRDDIQVRRP